MSDDKEKEVSTKKLAAFASGLDWEKHLKNKDVKKNLRAIYNIVNASDAPAAADAANDDDDGELSVHADDDAGATRVKLVVVGDGAVGKTSLLIVYATGKFPSTYLPTVFENYTAQMTRNDENILLHLWDTAGQEDYDRLRPLSYPGADVVLLCFSLVNRASYDAVRDKWAPEVRHYVPDIPHVLVGLKSDLRDAGEKDSHTGKVNPVTTEQGESLKEDVGAVLYAEVSAKTKAGLNEVFDKVVDIVLTARKQANNGGASNSDAGVVVSAKKKKKACMLV